MARYAVELLTNETKREMFGQACRRRAVENFDVKTIVVQYLKYYEECLGAGVAA
jgi:glycosyltransferase involved in cell wall biosynthesis